MTEVDYTGWSASLAEGVGPIPPGAAGVVEGFEQQETRRWWSVVFDTGEREFAFYTTLPRPDIELIAPTAA